MFRLSSFFLLALSVVAVSPAPVCVLADPTKTMTIINKSPFTVRITDIREQNQTPAGFIPFYFSVPPPASLAPHSSGSWTVRCPRPANCDVLFDYLLYFEIVDANKELVSMQRLWIPSDAPFDAIGVGSVFSINPAAKDLHITRKFTEVTVDVTPTAHTNEADEEDTEEEGQVAEEEEETEADAQPENRAAQLVDGAKNEFQAVLGKMKRLLAKLKQQL